MFTGKNMTSNGDDKSYAGIQPQSRSIPAFRIGKPYIDKTDLSPREHGGDKPVLSRGFPNHARQPPCVHDEISLQLIVLSG